jgi:hypothetical protein
MIFSAAWIISTVISSSSIAAVGDGVVVGRGVFVGRRVAVTVGVGVDVRDGVGGDVDVGVGEQARVRTDDVPRAATIFRKRLRSRPSPSACSIMVSFIAWSSRLLQLFPRVTHRAVCAGIPLLTVAPLLSTSLF